MKIDFPHRQSAHCESGVTANLISHYCQPVSEAMAFGVGAGLFFAYAPFIRLNDLPLTTFRSLSGAIYKRAMKELGITVKTEKFRSPVAAMAALDEALEEGIPVGLQTGAWWLPYFPPAYRFHFNMHNMVVFGKEGTEYLISDPVFPEPVRCDHENLMKARFTKGTMAPKGKMYTLTAVPEQLDLASAIKSGILAMTKAMLKTPLPIVGVKGIRFLANRLEKWPRKLGEEKALLCLGQLVRMQEEIGTGGAGFRFIYAAFLQEAAEVMHDQHFLRCSAAMTNIGDRWRDLAVMAARNCKGRARAEDSYPAMAAVLRDCAEQEKNLYLDLAEIVHS